MTQRPFVNVNDFELTPQTPQRPEAGFEARVEPIAAPLGATKLGCRLTVVPPGKNAFPHHAITSMTSSSRSSGVTAPCDLAAAGTR
jgi:hypothetical protein